MATRMYFYIDSRNQRQGPVQANQLPMFGVTLNTYVWTEGMKDWDMVKNVRDLASVFPIPVEKEHVNPIPSDNTSKSSNNQMGTQVDEVIEVPKYEEKSAIGWLIAIYIFAALGGFLGIVFGISTYMAKEKVYNPLLGDYEKVPRYKKMHRTLALIGALLSIVSIIVWQVALT
jgi:hypothetical protein